MYNHASLLLSFGSLFIAFNGKEIFCLFHIPKKVQIMCHSVLGLGNETTQGILRRKRFRELVI